MAVEDFLDGEVAIAVAATAALSSSRVRKALRRGVVYGLAGVLRAGDALAATAREAGRAAGPPGAPDPQGTAGTAAGATTDTAGNSGTFPGLVRRGAVSGLARAMTTGEVLAATARGAARNMQQATATVMQEAAAQAQAGGSGSGPPPTQPAIPGEAGEQSEDGVPVVEAGGRAGAAQPTRPAIPGEADVPGAGGTPAAKADPDA